MYDVSPVYFFMIYSDLQLVRFIEYPHLANKNLSYLQHTLF